MMVDMPGGDECHSPDCETIVAGDAGSRPGLCGHVLEKRDGREAHATELFHMCRPGDCVGARSRRGNILIVVG